MKRETLFCERGKHNWTRVTTRGHKPRNCKDKGCAERPAPVSEAPGTPDTGPVAAPVVTDTRHDITQLCERMEALKRLDAERLRRHRKGLPARDA